MRSTSRSHPLALALQCVALVLGTLGGAHVARAEDYALRKVGRDFRGDNQAHALSFTLHEGTASVATSEASGRPVEAQLELTGFGRIARLHPVALRGVSRQTGRIEYDRGPVREWFANGPRGLQQGFDVAERPAGDGPLVLEITFRGVVPVLRNDSTVALFADGRERLSYDTLRAWDADGKELSARMRVQHERVQLWVDDENARYPLVVDPYVQHQKLTPSTPYISNHFGKALAIEGDTLVVGAPGDETHASNAGAVHVFEWDGMSWNQVTTLFAQDPQSYGGFGSAVALSGDTMVVGAPKSSDEGAAYVFVRAGSSWRWQAKLQAASPEDGAYFGFAVAVQGDDIAIGEYGRKVTRPFSAQRQGRVYTYHRSGETWTETQSIVPRDSAGSFGKSLAISGDRLIVGAELEVTDGLVTGCAYVFKRRPDNGTWDREAILMPAPLRDYQYFGTVVRIDGDLAMVSASYDGPDGTGAVYVFERQNTAWVQRRRLLPHDPNDRVQFGSAIDLRDNRVVIGGWSRGGPESAAYVFTRAGNHGWVEYVKLTSPEPPAYHFALSVALHEDHILVGDPARSEADGFANGAVYAFLDRQLELGDACRNADECPTGYCVDGVCCNEACGGGEPDCHACSSALSGQPSGICTQLSAGASCGSPVDTLCDRADTCDANGRCLNNWANGTVCEGSDFCAVGDICRGGECNDGWDQNCLATEKCDEVMDLCYLACGDNVVDPTEECDLGTANSDTTPNRCRTNCRNPHCGDGVVDTLDECDRGAANSDTAPNGCRRDCRAAFCGDGVRDTGEGCDEGAANGTPSAPDCRADCSKVNCGDGVRDADEACDDGPLNSRVEADACRPTCVKAYCGDGVVDTGEVCDQGRRNADDLPDRCRTTCLPPSCGDGVVDTGEACEAALDGARCTSACVWDEAEADASMPAADEDADAGMAAEDPNDRTKASAGGCTVTLGSRAPWFWLMQLLGLALVRTARRARRRTVRVSAA